MTKVITHLLPIFSILHSTLYLVLCCCDLVWRSLSRSLLLSCFNMKCQIQSLGLLSTTQKWETLIVHKSFQWSVKLFILWKWCSPTQSLKTDNYPRTWNRINMHWSMSWTFYSANNKGNCHQSTQQGERLTLFLRQLSLATVYSLSPSEHAAQQKVPFQGCWSVTSLLIVGTPHFTLPSSDQTQGPWLLLDI